MTKKCSKCKKFKEIIHFYTNPSQSDGYANWCKDCYKEDRSFGKGQERNRFYARKARERNPHLQNEYDKKRKKQDPSFHLAKNLRTRISQIIRKNVRAGSAVRDLGCSVDELKCYLESKFQEGMTWQNYGQWHIDHIKPLAKFDLTNRESFLLACHYTNLQPLWAKDNLTKGSS